MPALPRFEARRLARQAKIHQRRDNSMVQRMQHIAVITTVSLSNKSIKELMSFLVVDKKHLYQVIQKTTGKMEKT